jgi:hypothetical protein
MNMQGHTHARTPTHAPMYAQHTSTHMDTPTYSHVSGIQNLVRRRMPKKVIKIQNIQNNTHFSNNVTPYSLYKAVIRLKTFSKITN